MNQRPPAKSAADAIGKIRIAYRALYAMGILCLFMSGVILTLAGRPGIVFVAALSALFGMLYLFLGFRVKRRSTAALIVAFILTALNVLAGIVNAVQTGVPGFLMLHVGILCALSPAQAAIKELKSAEQMS